MSIKVPKPLVRELRAKLRDYPEINYLYTGKESEDHQLARILFEALEKLSYLPPVLSESWSFEGTFPKALITYLLDLGVAITLREVCIWMIRNDFQYQAGNTSVRLYDRWRAYQTVIPGIEQSAMNSAQQWKTAYNANRAWGMSLTEMYEGWRILDSRDWVTVTV